MAAKQQPATSRLKRFCDASSASPSHRRRVAVKALDKLCDRYPWSGPDGIYVAMPGVVRVVDPSTGRAISTIPSPAIQDLAYIGTLDR